MDLDVDVARLKIMKADYKTKQYRLEDSLIHSFPAEIAKTKEQIEALKQLWDAAQTILDKLSKL